MASGVLEQLLGRVEALERRLAAPEPAEPPALLTASQVAAMLGTNRRALAERMRRARRAGDPHPLEGAAVLVDGTRRWPRDQVRQYLATLTSGTARRSRQ